MPCGGAEALDNPSMPVKGPVGKVQPCDIHSGPQQAGHDVNGFRGGTNGAYNFGFIAGEHDRVPPGKENIDKALEPILLTLYYEFEKYRDRRHPWRLARAR
ncbi:MAG: hypothetical protein BWX80_04000 [Candidatus Hydrogenedentes bacterium ADurb.Bin101]|nr:MAG: hypothetical protein BWX80_04000 [Candidatus Hydrogenedentes bacterium ADurb.Bin101]